MKNKIRLFGLIAITAIIGLVFTSCGDLDNVTKSNLTGTVTFSSVTPKTGEIIIANYNPGNGTGLQTWQWYRVTADGDLSLTGTGNNYTPVAADVGFKLKAVVSYADQNGSLSAVTASAVAASDTLDPGDNTDPDEEKENPITAGSNFLLVSNRVNSWDGIDIRNANPFWGKNASGWTTGKNHTIIIEGWAGVGESVILAEGEKGTILSLAYTDVNGMYKIEKEVSWDLVNSDSCNFRIQGPTTTKEFAIFDITIKDTDGVIKYKLSTDFGIQIIEQNTVMDWTHIVGTNWFYKSGSPTITVIAVSKSGYFVAVTDIDGVPLSAIINVDIALPRYALPGSATNGNVIWEIKSAGTTGASLTDNKLKATAIGKVIVTGTVVNGKSPTENFVKDFEIEIINPFEENPIVPTGKYFLVSDRANSWDGIDIRNANPSWGNNASGWTAGKAHTIIIEGWAGAGESVTLVEGEKGTILSQVYADANGMYKIEKEVSWDLVNSDANNFRIQGPTATKQFIVFEITIKDIDGVVKYKLSTDPEIQSIEHDTVMLDWSNKVGTTWFLRSGGPTITVMDPSAD